MFDLYIKQARKASKEIEKQEGRGEAQCKHNVRMTGLEQGSHIFLKRKSSSMA